MSTEVLSAFQMLNGQEVKQKKKKLKSKTTSNLVAVYICHGQLVQDVYKLIRL